MDTQMYENQTALQEEINSAFIGAMSRVYLYMTGGLVLTTIVAMVVALNPDIQAAVFSSGIIVFGLIGAQLGLVLLISATINKLAPPMALALFFIYAALMGVTLSVIFVVYDLGSIGLAFGATASIFAGLSIAGLTTKKDLTGEAVLQGDALAVSRIGAIGALKLYLDLINLFIFILSITGGRK